MWVVVAAGAVVLLVLALFSVVALYVGLLGSVGAVGLVRCDHCGHFGLTSMREPLRMCDHCRRGHHRHPLHLGLHRYGRAAEQLEIVNSKD